MMMSDGCFLLTAVSSMPVHSPPSSMPAVPLLPPAESTLMAPVPPTPNPLVPPVPVAPVPPVVAPLPDCAPFATELPSLLPAEHATNPITTAQAASIPCARMIVPPRRRTPMTHRSYAPSFDENRDAFNERNG